ncbi:AAA family ATPase [Xanthomonas translucens]|nr:AAA family ATPase [Xanthomonas translucens]MQS43218.1 AAA family ATPase [Xanthomonas translucens pv. translucens]UKE58543.1 AAA family ATPase [Xanthomonas translucens pv. hordei]WIH01550.1 AAA family ATPase [Xanthomonas translucens pv. hordei]
MYIHRVILRDVKSFENLELRFDRKEQSGAKIYSGWNVLTGDNSAGKTTVLKAIALALVGPDVARALQPSFNGWIREGSEDASIAVQIFGGDEDKFTTGRPPLEPFYAEISLEKRGGEVYPVAGNEYVKKKKSALNGPWAIGQGAWFAVAYGPFRRLYGTSTEAMRLMSAPGRPPRFATLFKEDATLGEGQTWLKELQFKSLELKDKERGLLKDVLDILDADFLRHGLRVERVDSEGLWLRNELGMVLPLSDMSDGYRSSLALLIDILRHLADVFPGVPLIAKDEGGDPYVAHAGVVLIDEVDAHLHPEWQRQLGFWLKKHFPNVQFIVSSHSAFVCQAADDLGVYYLGGSEGATTSNRVNEEQWKEIVSGTADEVLRSVAFGLKHTRSPKAVDARREWSHLKAKMSRLGLNQDEETRMIQLSLFVDSGEDKECVDMFESR